MREIKFRAWDKANNEMLDIEDLHWDDCTREFLIRTTMYSDYFDTEDMILMQYTGLKDKNGKEIYEGDILRFSKVDTAVVKWNKRYSYFMVESIQDYYFDSDVLGQALEYNDNVEIIGNIYDNPELLKED